MGRCRIYSMELKRDAVSLMTEKGDGFSEAARNLGVHVSLLRKWKEKLAREQGGARLSPDE